MEDGDAPFVMHRDYRYAALVLPLHLDRWNATDRKEMSKRVRRQFDLGWLKSNAAARTKNPPCEQLRREPRRTGGYAAAP